MAGKLGKATLVDAAYQTVEKPAGHVAVPEKLVGRPQPLLTFKLATGAPDMTLIFNRIAPDSVSTHEGVPSDFWHRTR